MESTSILTKEIAYRKLQRIAYEIAERNADEQQIFLAGIKQSGLIIARILHDFLQPICKAEIIVIELAVDKKDPRKSSLSQQINFDDKTIIITDDVVNSGKTLLYALRPFLEFYPKKIQTVVLVERSYKEFPVTPDYVGLSVATALSEKIIVETDGEEIAGARLA
jgi:pyrimidine operon attenuation protein / uracil phosphoribosyltransferase